jgi:hypothetical protein
VTGYQGSATTPPKSADSHLFLLHYIQGQWTEVTTLNNAEGVATSVSMDSTSDGWAIEDVHVVGDSPMVTWLLHYNGQQWAQVPALAFPQSQHKLLMPMCLQMLSATEGWAVGSSITYGSQHDSNGNQLILSWTAVIVQYHNGTWSIVPTS